MMLNEQSITQALSEAASHLRNGSLDQAGHTLDVLEFVRLLRTEQRRDKGSSQRVDPAQPFGPERVRQTGDHIRRCLSAIGRKDGDDALREAEAAVTRWSQKET
jgi:hypothetical protein